jgi:hypothetical protein
MALQGKINSWREELMAQIKEIDGEWETSRNVKIAEYKNVLEFLEKNCQLLGYFGRWSAQIQERIVQLSL